MTKDLRLPEQRPLRDQVHDVLENLIIHRTIEPGSRLRDQELSESFGVSRGPVREAILALQKDGWVEIRHRQGAFVRTPHPAEAEQLFQVRRCLESQAAELAAERISADQLSELRNLVEQGVAALDAEDMQAVVDLNTHFHRVVAQASGNLILRNMLEQIEKRIVWYLSAVMVFRGRDSWKEHRQLVTALDRHDPDQAAQIMARHTTATYEAYAQTAEGDDHKGAAPTG